MTKPEKTVFASSNWVYAPAYIYKVRQLPRIEAIKKLRLYWDGMPAWAFEAALSGEGYDNGRGWVVEKVKKNPDPEFDAWLKDWFANANTPETLAAIAREEAAILKEKKRVEKEVKSKSCPKCEGTGYLPMYHYHKGGECFRCHGTGAR